MVNLNKQFETIEPIEPNCNFYLEFLRSRFEFSKYFVLFYKFFDLVLWVTLFTSTDFMVIYMRFSMTNIRPIHLFLLFNHILNKL